MRNASTYTETELIAGCGRGDRSAQRILYERYSSVMYPVCVRYLGREDAKDVLQDGFLTVFDKIGTYKGEGSFEGWMRKIFVNACLMRIRKGDVLRYSEDISESPELGGTMDYGVMERAKLRYTIPAEFGWSDIGTWGSLYTHAEKDTDGNALKGKGVVTATKNSVINIEDGIEAIEEGLDGYLVAYRDKSLLVCRLADEQHIKEWVERL